METSDARKRRAELAAQPPAPDPDETCGVCTAPGLCGCPGALDCNHKHLAAPDPDEACGVCNDRRAIGYVLGCATCLPRIGRSLTAPAPPATTGPADEAEGLAEFRIPPSRRGRFENVRKAGIQHYNERPDDSTTPAGGGVPSSASRAVEHQAATVSPAGPNLAELIHRAISPTGMDRCHQDGDGYAKCVHVADTVLASDWLTARDAAQQRIGAESLAATKAVLADREAELLALKGPCSNRKCRLHYAHSGPCDCRADRIAREGRA